MPRIATSIVVAGAACFVFAAYALVVLKAATLVGTLTFLGLSAFLLAALAPRLTGRLTFGLRGLQANLKDLPAAPEISPNESKAIAAQIVTADAAITPSHVMALSDVLTRREPVGFVEVDLGTGHEWLSSRLFITAELLRRARGAHSIIFLATQNGTTRDYVGIADISSVRWGLAQRYPTLDVSSQ